MENTTVGPFLIIKKLGAHRRHNVYLARQTEQDREVALKFVKLPPHVDRDTAYAKINREVAVIKQLDHPNIVKLFGAGTHEEKIFFAHECVDGEALSAILGRRNRLAIDQVIDFGTQIGTALQFLHENEIMHAKLTADKVLIDSEGVVKLSDLRLNRSRKRRWDASKRASLETAAYMAPEQLMGEGATIKTDLYSFGVILYEMLTGQLPFDPQTMAQLARDKQNGNTKRVCDTLLSCPSWLDELVGSMIDVDPKKRPHTAKAAMLTLDQIRVVDQSQKAVVEEMTSGFSALTAGKDNTEARRLLGQKPQKKKQSGPLLQSLPFLIGGLMFVTLVSLLIAFWPFSIDRTSRMEQADALLASAEYDDWKAARRIYERLMDSSDEEVSGKATASYKLARRKSMLHRLDNAIATGLERPEIRDFRRGYMMEKDDRFDEAVSMYQQFVESFDPDSPRMYVRDEAQERLDRLTAARKIAKEFGLQVEEQLQQATRLSHAPATVNQAREIWQAVSETYGDNPFMKGFVAKADAALDDNPEFVAEEEEKPTTADPAEDGKESTDSETVDEVEPWEEAKIPAKDIDKNDGGSQK